MRFFVLLCLLSLIVAACDADFSSDDDEPPTPIIITSTPAGEVDDPTATGDADADGPTATPNDGSATTEPGDNATATEPDEPATPTEEDDADATGTPAGNDETRALIEEIELQVVELRGLELLDDLNEEIIDRAELESRVETIVAEEYSPEEARVEALTYWLLRLIPDGSLDLYQLQIDLLNEQVAGYYDPESDQLVVVTDDGTLTAFDKVTMAHEITHALQDQHFDLVAIDEFASDTDRSAAISALIEGDASLAMTDYMFSYLDPMDLIDLLGESLTGGEEFEVLDNAPRYISDGLIFSYEAGQAFATALVEEGGYARVDEAFLDPPLSTEQIIHPEKYMSAERDEPVDVQNPDVAGDLGSGWEVIKSDVLGEWDLQIMLEENGVATDAATTAAEGWGGSWYDIYESGDDSLALLTTRWDSDQDATEFSDALLDSFSGDAALGAIWEEDGRFFSAVGGGDTVVLISGTSEASVSAVLAVMSQTV